MLNQLENISQLFCRLQSGKVGKETMPTTLSHLLTCTRIIKDAATGLFTFLDVFDVIYIPKESDFYIQSFVIAGKLYIDSPGHVKVEVRFLLPDGSESTSSIAEGDVVIGSLQIGLAFQLFKFALPGRYFMRVKCNGVELQTHNHFYFDVIKLQ